MFCTGLLQDPRPLVEHCYQMHIEMRLKPITTCETLKEARRQLEAQGKSETDLSLFDDLYRESTVPLPGHHYHNQYLNFYKHRTRINTTPITTPSRWYEFTNIKQVPVLDISQAAEIPEECGMQILVPDPSVTQSLLSTYRAITQRQPVTHLTMSGVRCSEVTAADSLILSRNAQSVILDGCVLPDGYMVSIVRQLTGCRTLQSLLLVHMNLAGVEGDLDELLEDLVSLHEHGQAQTNLILWLFGEETKTNLSEEFITKWCGRCEGIKTIAICLIKS